MKVEVVIPVCHRPAELRRLLNALQNQSHRDFAVCVVDNHPLFSSEEIVRECSERLNIRRLFEERQGPGPARNWGAASSNADVFMFVDSDCLPSPHYIQNLLDLFRDTAIDIAGGPEGLYPDSTSLQKGIDFAMTSFFSTGGLRGGPLRLTRFYPRGGNMAIRSSVFKRLGGFSHLRYGEDIELGLRAEDKGYNIVYSKDLLSLHARRATYADFLKQVYHAGYSKSQIRAHHEKGIKWIHFMPLVLSVTLLLSAVTSLWALLAVLALPVTLGIASSFHHHSLRAGAHAFLAFFVQTFGFAAGFVYGLLKKTKASQNTVQP
jgi:GT2 family glycosyltransferase